MKFVRSTNHRANSAAVALFLTAAAINASAATLVWQDTFSTARATAPNPYDYAGGAAGNDYTVTTEATAGAPNITTTVAGGIFSISDQNNPNGINVTVAANQFAPFSLNSGDRITFGMDFSVSSMIAGAGNSVPRINLVDNGTEVFTLGFGYGAFDSDASATDLGFYAVVGGAATAVGGPVGTNGAGGWLSGFDFGNYNSGSAISNDTGGFYRIEISLTQGSTDLSGTITSLTNPADTASFTKTLALATNFSNVGSDGFRLRTGFGGLSETSYDNISVNIVPEPGRMLLLGAGLAGLTMRRRRRQRQESRR